MPASDIEAVAGATREGFDAIFTPEIPRLRAVVRRMIGHPEDTDDVVQETLLKAWEGRASFRGDSSVGTWLCAIGARAAVDHLRRRKRWRAHAQVAHANACASSERLGGEIGTALSRPDFHYEAKEHIGYCFTCVGRSLDPDGQAALVLREVLGFTDRESAAALDLSESAFRHSLSRARHQMESTYEGLCSLVNKRGVCYQCKGLREFAPAGREGGAVPALPTFGERLATVRAANVDSGMTQALHDVFWRQTAVIEDEGKVSDIPQTDCGQ